MKFSLILATVGRSQEVQAMLESLQRQTWRDFEVIVVDQNTDRRVQDIVESRDWGFDMVRVTSSPGLSHARNQGLRHVHGDLVAFPDDDCWYGPDLLAMVHAHFERLPDVDGLTGRSIDHQRRESGGRFSRDSDDIDVRRVWSMAISYTIFLRRAVCDRLPTGFDETLGVGANTRFGSGEETDYLLRALHEGSRLRYLPEITVFHPNKTLTLDAAAVRKAYQYGMGMGRVLSKHLYPWTFRLKVLLRPLAGAALAALSFKSALCQYRWATMTGRLHGMLAKE